ncbi:hypothetical protein [Methanoculleus sp.]|nr:hypothetical protein [Methanoculleus sp.]
MGARLAVGQEPEHRQVGVATLHQEQIVSTVRWESRRSIRSRS